MNSFVKIQLMGDAGLGLPSQNRNRRKRFPNISALIILLPPGHSSPTATIIITLMIAQRSSCNQSPPRTALPGILHKPIILPNQSDWAGGAAAVESDKADFDYVQIERSIDRFGRRGGNGQQRALVSIVSYKFAGQILKVEPHRRLSDKWPRPIAATKRTIIR